MLRSALFAFLIATVRGAPGDDSSDSSDSSSTYCDPCGADVKRRAILGAIHSSHCELPRALKSTSTACVDMEMEVDTPDSDRVPVTIITGFLGSGKTTLLNHILTATHGKKIAVIENEFGDVSIDDKLIAKNSKFRSDEEIVEVLNGCICCSVRQDLVAILEKLAGRVQLGDLVLDAIVIETTGMADPAPVGLLTSRLHASSSH